MSIINLRDDYTYNHKYLPHSNINEEDINSAKD